MNSVKIIHCFINKDNTFFRNLYQDNYFKSQYFILKNGGTKEDAQEVFQLAFIILYDRISKKKFIPENIQQLEAYLFQIVKNKWFDQCKSKSKKINFNEFYEISEEVHEDEFSSYNSEFDIQINQMNACLEKIKEPCKSLLKQFYYEKLSYQEIANQSQYNPTTLKTMKYRCLNKLKKLYHNF